jgi:hypothetical protein
MTFNKLFIDNNSQDLFTIRAETNQNKPKQTKEKRERGNKKINLK